MLFYTSLLDLGRAYARPFFLPVSQTHTARRCKPPFRHLQTRARLAAQQTDLRPRLRCIRIRL